MTTSITDSEHLAPNTVAIAPPKQSGDGPPRTVFVLGAGFTKAFLPNAPLLKDYYDLKDLATKYGEFKHAKRILKLALALAAADGGRVDLERLMTRLDAPTPYDYVQGSSHVLRQLLADVKQLFVKRLSAATNGERPYEEELDAFAKCCVNQRVNCITFNYDDVFDFSLDKANHVHGGLMPDVPRWHPTGGYGFFCKPSEQCVRERPDEMELCSMLLLKLHGSVNWRVRKGEPLPYRMDSLLHHEDWHTPYYDTTKIDVQMIEPFLDREPFLVPPVMNKTTLIEQPILQHLWATAFEFLANATNVVFLGYSLPITDAAAGFLFGEALRNLDRSRIKVVVLADTDDSKKALKASYSCAIPDITDDVFEFSDARQWCNEFVAHSAAGAAT